MSKNNRTKSLKDSILPLDTHINLNIGGVGNLYPPLGGRMGRLKNIIASKGISATFISKQTSVHKAQVSAFINNNKSRLLKSTKKTLRLYFIELGFLQKSKPRKPTTCLRCGMEYPTRKSVSKSETDKKGN